MNLVEFSHLVHTTGAFHWKTHGKKIEEIFSSVIVGDDGAEGESKDSVDLLSRCDFVYALVKVALRNTKDSEQLIKAVKIFFTEQLATTWENELLTYYTHKSDSFLQKTLEQYSDYAKSVFKKFSSRAKSCDVINVADFKNLFVTMVTVRQNDDEVINNAFLSPMPSNSEFDELCVAEFLEAICHLAIAVVPDLDTDKITDIQKIRMLYQSIADFQINGEQL
jgi:flagellar biosynthesis protein FlhB